MCPNFVNCMHFRGSHSIMSSTFWQTVVHSNSLLKGWWHAMAQQGNGLQSKTKQALEMFTTHVIEPLRGSRGRKRMLRSHKLDMHHASG